MKIVYSIEDVDNVAREVIKNVKSKIIFLYGNMGVGKTTLIKSLVKHLGSKDNVNSPTFSIVNEYMAIDDVIYHFDLYRVKDIEEVYNFGIEDYLYSNKWSLIEWPELIEQIAPKCFDKISIELNDDNTRTLELSFNNN